MNPLIIAYVFPPISYAGTYRTLRLFRWLRKQGHNPTVLTIKVQDDLHNDFSLIDPQSERECVVRTRIVDIHRAYQRIKKRILGMPLGNLLNKIFCRALYYLNQPDHMVFWVPFATVAAHRLIRRGKIDVIYTSSPPHSVQIVGYLLKKVHGVRWVADLRDPIMSNMGATSLQPWARHIHHLVERAIVKYADVIIMNTEIAREALRASHGVENVRAIFNSYDDGEFVGISREKAMKFTIAHVGSLYGLRKADLILEVVSNLAASGAIRPESFQLQLVGLNDQRTVETISRLGIEEYVHVRDMVSHREALIEMSSAHLLILLKGYGKNSDGQVPGKLFEYIGLGGKILGIGPKSSEAARIVGSAGAGYWVDDDPEAVCSIIRKEYREYLGGEYRPQCYSNVRNRYNCEGMAAAILEAMLPEGK